jgi:hypothetical protein
MLLFQALRMQVLGRAWRASEASQPDESHSALFRLFEDEPSTPFGLHALTLSGDAKPGCWLGPHAMCHALSSAVQRSLSGTLLVEIVGAGGGGAPTLYVEDVAAACEAVDAPPPAEAAPLPLLTTRRVNSDGAEPWTPLLLLLPLRLGPERTIEAAYIPQLCAALKLPSSVGVLGGRPGHSLWFVGVCESNALLYLDPHETHPHAAAVHSRRSRALRHMPVFTVNTPPLYPRASVSECARLAVLKKVHATYRGGRRYVGTTTARTHLFVIYIPTPATRRRSHRSIGLSRASCSSSSGWRVGENWFL